MNHRHVCLSLYLLGGLLLAGCERKAAPPPPPVPEVTVSKPIERTVADYLEFTGRTDAVYTVDIRARVNGYLVKVNFKDGDMVKEGDVLYEIDPRPYQADLDKAKGDVQRLLGQKKLLETQVDRYTKLVAKMAASQQDLDQYIGQQAENLGGLATAKSQVEYATLNLDFCTIKSPINGMISRTYIQIGNLISADKSLLTTIVSVDPMYAYFNVDEPTLLRVRKMLIDKQLTSIKQTKYEVDMGLADDVDRKYPLRGTLDFVNNQVDRLTGTITVRGTFANANRLLSPGMFARVRIPLGEPQPRLLVTERAIGTDQGYKYLYVVDDTNHVQYRRVKLGRLVDGFRVVEEGLKASEWVVVNGLQRVRQGSEVKPEREDMAKQPIADEPEKKPTPAKTGTGAKDATTPAKP